MTRPLVCGLLALVAFAASACATQHIAGRNTQDIRDEIILQRIADDSAGIPAISQ